MSLRNAAVYAITNTPTTRVLEVACPYCFTLHCHNWAYVDPEPGIRVAPCTDDGSPYYPQGTSSYLVVGFRGRFVDGKAKR